MIYFIFWPAICETLANICVELQDIGLIKGSFVSAYAVTGRLHPNFFALSTDTGRFSCNSPNCQNMPRKTNDPIGVRNFIKAPKGRIIVSCDYSQIELRVGAHYCQDEIMLDTYRRGGDIHAATTSVIFNIPYDQAVDKRWHSLFRKIGWMRRLLLRVQFIPIGVYTIVEVRNGKGSSAGWGRLKSGIGWISLDFVRRI